MDEKEKLDELKQKLSEKYELAKKLDSNAAYLGFIDMVKLTPRFIETVNNDSELKTYFETSIEGQTKVGIETLSKDQKNLYRNAIKRIKNGLVPEESSQKKDKDKSDWSKVLNDKKWLLGTLLILAGLAVPVLIWQFTLPQPKLLITDISPKYFIIMNEDKTNLDAHRLEFRVSSTGSREIGTKVGFGVQQINATADCENYIDFFPKNLTQLCHIATTEHGFETRCTPDIPPAKTQGIAIDINASLRDVLERYLNKTNETIDNCRSNETISICALYENNWHDCSPPITIQIEYT